MHALAWLKPHSLGVQVLWNKMINVFNFHLRSITNEAGASIYSVSPEAVKEMPDMDPNLRSAGTSLHSWVLIL